MNRTEIKSCTLTELTGEMKQMGQPAYRAKQVYDWMHCKLADSFSEMTNLSKELRTELEDRFFYTLLEPVEILKSELDGTCKYLFQIPDEDGVLKNNVIESVLMRYRFGNSVCISSQVGCRMGCRFCASTIGGLERNLTAAEMLEQIYRIQKLTGERVSHVVVMGTGEPMDNLEQLLRFISILTDENGLQISQRNITVSTCGLVEQMRAFAERKLSVNIAVSLHAPNDALRKTLMPVAERYTIKEVTEAADYYFEQTGRRVTYEYSLVRGVNDGPSQAQELGELLKHRNCHVNLIPVNPIDERNYESSFPSNVQNFKNILEKIRINVTIRREMGSDIKAACGQLRKSRAKAAVREEE